MAVYKARGIALQHGARKGRRRQESAIASVENTSSRGGKRIKSENYDLDDLWIHESVIHLIREGVKQSEQRFQDLPENTEQFTSV